MIMMYFSYWKSRLPRQGWLYLSVNQMCFYAYIFAKETKLMIRWTDITQLSKTNSIVFPDSIHVVTRDNKEVNYLKIFDFLQKHQNIISICSIIFPCLFTKLKLMR